MTNAVVGNATAAVQSTVAAATSAAATALQNLTASPGPLLQWLTIGYIGLLIVSLYPITVSVRKCRKRRKRKSASRKAARDNNDHGASKGSGAAADLKAEPLAKTSSAETDSESSSSSSSSDDGDDDDSKITAYHAPGPPAPVSTHQDYVSPTLPPPQDENQDDATSRQSENSESLTDLITDWRMSRNEQTGEAIMVDMEGLPVSLLHCFVFLLYSPYTYIAAMHNYVCMQAFMLTTKTN